MKRLRCASSLLVDSGGAIPIMARVADRLHAEEHVERWRSGEGEERWFMGEGRRGRDAWT